MDTSKNRASDIFSMYKFSQTNCVANMCKSVAQIGTYRRMHQADKNLRTNRSWTIHTDVILQTKQNILFAVINGLYLSKVAVTKEIHRIRQQIIFIMHYL